MNSDPSSSKALVSRLCSFNDSIEKIKLDQSISHTEKSKHTKDTTRELRGFVIIAKSLM